MTEFVDRAEERAALDRLVAAASSGMSGTCVLVGDAGMGKTRLLEYAVETADEIRHLVISGVETETDLGYAALHRLLLPFLTQRERLPMPQRAALEFAFGLESGEPADRFLVGLACLNLLADVATERGLLCVVDDAQWIDRESLEALSFVARRLQADGIALLFGIRDLSAVAGALDGLPTLSVGGLPDDAALALLSSSVDSMVEPETARRIVTSTGGCPLALIELASGLTQQQLRGGQPVDDLPIGRQLEDHFLRKVRDLDEGAQTFLLVAAAESSGDPLLVRRAAFALGADDKAEDAAVMSGLVTLRPNVVFRHPLVRAAVYASAPQSVRSTVHETLARLIDRTDPDRRARHLAAAAREPDEKLALQLEKAAERAAGRGGYAAEVSFMLEAASLSPAPAEQARRLLRAATAAFNAGSDERAEALLEQARPNLDDPVLATEALRLEGRIRIGFADPRSVPARLLAAAHALESLEPTSAREAFLEALEACSVAEYFSSDVTPPDVARAALAALGHGGDSSTVADSLLEGIALLFLSDYAAAVPLLQRVTRAMRGEPIAREDLARWFHLGVLVATDLYDDVSLNAWLRRVEQHARDVGAFVMLQVVLLGRARQEVRAGELMAADMTYDEVVEVARLLNGPAEFFELLKADVYAWRGLEAQTRAAAAPLKEIAAAVGNAQAANVADLAIAVLELGSGRYGAALAALESLVSNQQLGWTCLGLATAVEAAARTDQHELAARYLADLQQHTTAAGTEWALGQLARCRAMVADDSDAEDLYLEAIGRLEATTIATELAQARLNYGEWLRRQGRHIEARSPLHTAYVAFEAMGAASFADRARAELAATGEKIARRISGPVPELTPQESQAARLAANGATNAEIATRMFISANTVDYHLRKVFRKLGVKSRRELASALTPLAAPGGGPVSSS